MIARKYVKFISRDERQDNLLVHCVHSCMFNARNKFHYQSLQLCNKALLDYETSISNCVAILLQCKSQRITCLAIVSHAIFLLQEALHESESGSTFGKDCCKAATIFSAIAQCNIPLQTCFAIFPLSSQ